MKFLNGTRRAALILVLAFICFLTVPGKASAAPAHPEKVARLIVSSVGENKMTLKWTKVAYANGYVIQVLSGTKYVTCANIKSGSTLTKTFTGLTNDRTYTYRIFAYRTLGTPKKNYFSLQPSNTASGTPKVTPPAAPVLKIYANNDSRVSITWNRVANAAGYMIYQKSSGGRWVRIGNSTSTSSKVTVTINKLTNGQTYQFVVRAYRKVGTSYGFSALSNIVVGKPFALYPSMIRKIHGQYYNARVTRAVTVTCNDGTKLSLAKGKSIQVILKSGSTLTCAINKNYARTFKLTTSDATLTSFLTDSSSTATFGRTLAAAYVNCKGYSSQTPYFLWVNIYTQHMYVFKGSQYNWTCVFDVKVATGVLDTPTKVGLNRVYNKKVTASFEEDWYGKYVTWIQLGQAVHSWLYTMRAGFEQILIAPAEHYGSPISNGCIRTNWKNSKWVYDNVPYYTQTLVY